MGLDSPEHIYEHSSRPSEYSLQSYRLHENGYRIDTAPSGATYPDPLEDTEPGGVNLMSGEGVLLTRDQAWVLGRSPLLR